MKKTLVIAIVVALCVLSCVSCEMFYKLKGTYAPGGDKYWNAPYQELLFEGNSVKAYVNGDLYEGHYSLDKNHITISLIGLGSERHKFEWASSLDFWLDDKYNYRKGSNGYF